MTALKKPDIKLKGGFIDGKVYNVADVTALSKLPPKEQIIAQLLGSLNAPASNLVGTLNNIIGDFVRTIQAIAINRALPPKARKPLHMHTVSC